MSPRSRPVRVPEDPPQPHPSQPEEEPGKSLSTSHGGARNGGGRDATPVRFEKKSRSGPVSLIERKKERSSARRRLLAFRIAIAALLAATIGAVAYLFLFSSVFALELDSVEVEGAALDGAGGAVQPIVEPFVGTPLPRVPTAKITDELLSQPLIAEASVSRSWPHGLHVVLVPREAVAMVQFEGEYALVGEDGVVTTTSAEPVEGLPLIVVSATDIPHLTSQAATGVLVRKSLPEVISQQVDVVEVNGRIVTLSLADGSRVVWGDEADSELKGEVLSILMEGRPAEVYDVRDPRHPVTS